MNRLIAGFAVLLFAAAPAAADDSARASLGGNEFLAGGQVELGGRVRRNAFVSGGDVTVEASVGRNLFAAGGDVRLAGEVEGDARLAGGALSIARDASVAGDATLAGGTIEVDGPVGGDLHAFGERIVVNGVVDGDVRMAGEDLRIGPDARIAGRVLYRSDEALVVASGAQLAGGVERSTSDRAWRRAARGASIISGITISLGMVLLGAILVLGMPRFSREAAASIRSKPWHALGLGIVMLVGVPMALVALVVTIIGIPLAVLLAFAYGALLMLGWLIAAIFLGDLALERIDAAKLGSVWWRALFMLLAIVVIAIVKQVPVAGPIVCWLLFLAGVGAFTLRAWRGFRNETAPAV
ncbi:MAG: bactofilin family protein [Steroidobacteraceae bacterium]